MLRVLVEAGRAQDVRVRALAVLTLRNLLFSRELKTRMLQDDGGLSAIAEALLHDDRLVQMYAAHALWALLYNHEKAKAIVRLNGNLVGRVIEAENRLLADFGAAFPGEQPPKATELLAEHAAGTAFSPALLTPASSKFAARYNTNGLTRALSAGDLVRMALVAVRFALYLMDV